jgi:hypothetical protein
MCDHRIDFYIFCHYDYRVDSLRHKYKKNILLKLYQRVANNKRERKEETCPEYTTKTRSPLFLPNNFK